MWCRRVPGYPNETVVRACKHAHAFDANNVYRCG